MPCGENEGSDALQEEVNPLVTSPRYFRTLGLPVREGREFTDADRGSGLPVVIVNQRFATTYWRGEDPLGKRLRLFAGTTRDAWLTVIGVATTRAVVTLVGLRT